MTRNEKLVKAILLRWPSFEKDLNQQAGEITIEIPRDKLFDICLSLRDEADFCFDTLIDVCAVDYLHYGQSEWLTSEATAQGFDRGVEPTHEIAAPIWQKPRFAVVYHLSSVHLNHRIRLKTFCQDDTPMVDSVVDVWPAANWFEREAFDLYGVLFKGHPDLRRILTDYGFIGHPFRKDFPVYGEMEMRYDAHLGRVVYEKVDIIPRVLVPRVIRRESLERPETNRQEEISA